MGIQELLKKLPGASTFYKGFCRVEAKGETIALDAGGLLHHCARVSKDHYLVGEYRPALQIFMSFIQELHFMLEWDLCVVFDGCRSDLKKYEYERRAGNQVHITAAFTALAAKVCSDLYVPYIVAATEADPQCLEVLPEIGKASLIVTGDADLLAYGAQRVVFI